MEAHNKPRLRRFRRFLRDNDISTTHGYDLVKRGLLEIVKVGNGSYITSDCEERFIEAVKSGAAGPKAA